MAGVFSLFKGTPEFLTGTALAKPMDYGGSTPFSTTSVQDSPGTSASWDHALPIERLATIET